jgi:hypothetical protein
MIRTLFGRSWKQLKQCHIKARALRAAAQGPKFKRGPHYNVSLNIQKMKHIFYENFHKLDIPKALMAIIMLEKHSLE